MIMTSDTVRPALVAMALTALGTMAASSHAAPYVPDLGSEAYDSVLFAGGDLQVAEDGSVTGNVHGNAGVILASGTVIDGDLSAVGAIDLDGAVVTGSVTSPVPPRQPPALPTGAEARLLADRVLEGDHVFPDGTVVDDLVYVAGTARFEGSVDGVGTVIAGVEIRFDNALPHAPVVLDAGTRMSFVSLGDLWVGQRRPLRGLLLAAGAMELHKELDFEGVVVAGGALTAAKDAVIAYLPADPEPSPLTVVIEEPVDASLTNQATVEVRGTVTGGAQIVGARVNGQPATLTGRAYSIFLPLEQGFNAIQVVATDSLGDVAFANVVVTLDTEPPRLSLSAPRAGQLVNGASVQVVGEASDNHALDQVSVDGMPVQVTGGLFTADVALLQDGLTTIHVEALDLAGNSTTVARDVVRFSLPAVDITAPADLSFIAATTVDVAGTVSAGVSTVTVNGAATSLQGTSFLAQGVPLIEGGNILTATATDSQGHVATATVHVVRDLTPPRVAIYRPADGATVYDGTVSVSGLIHDVVAGTVNASEATVNVNGIPAQVVNRSFFAEDVPLAPGANELIATAVDAAGNLRETSVSVTYETAPAARIRIVSGNLQSGVIGTQLPQPLVVELLDAAGQPVAGKPVFFRLAGNDGALDGGRRRLAAASDAAGRAWCHFTLGGRAGIANQVVEASAAGFAGPAVFTASAQPGAPELIVVDSGGLQVGVAGRRVPRPLIAAVVDSGHNRLEGVPVLFEVVKGQGTFADGSRSTLLATDSDGRAIVTFRLDPEEGVANNVVAARLEDSEDGPAATFVASGRAAGDPAATSISGVVLDNTSVPIEGVTARIKDTALTAVTDAEGQFRIDAAPVGSMKLIIDGSTADRPGSWPHLDFDLVTIPGRDNTVNMPIYLLPLDLASGLYVDETDGGTLTLPDVPGFALEVAPGSVTFPGGGRSGLVSVTVVHSDRVPMVPNFGQQPRLIVTIQPAAARFEPSARLTLPNVEGLAPGEVTEMYSFDHDLGHFVSIGPATVSEDGRVLRSDPGIGIVKAGWHCGGNPSGAGTPHACPECNACDGSSCIAADTGCSLEDPCIINDRCENGSCVGDERKLISVDAKANGADIAVVDFMEPVTFLAAVEHEGCDSLTSEWDFDAPDTPLKSQTTHGPFTFTYDTPGTHRYTVDVDCNDGCDEDGDRGVVLVRCPEVEIVGTDPDTGVLCGSGCKKEFFAEVSPPGLTLKWEITEGSDLVSAPFPTSLTSASVEASADEQGDVTVRASVEAASVQCPSASAQLSFSVFVPPANLPIIGDLTPGEIGLGVQLAHAAALGDAAALTCISALVGIKEASEAESRNLWNEQVPGCGHRDRDPANALLHAMGSCLTAAVCGSNVAKHLWDAHENHNENECSRAYLDFHNNDAGRNLAVPSRPDVCGVLVRSALTNGLLLWAKEPSNNECETEEDLERFLSADDPCLADPPTE